jgi:exodeoxyribonuclease VIII
MNDIMLDLETMGQGPDAAIIAIGAAGFDPDTNSIGERFYTPCDLASSVAQGGVIDASTVLWWLRQGDAARGEFAKAGLPIRAALVAFTTWIARHFESKNVRVWGNGAAFDNVILSGAFRRAGMETPWRFYNDRCYRTMKAQAPGITLVRSGTEHNAVDDAFDQAAHLLEILASLRK